MTNKKAFPDPTRGVEQYSHDKEHYMLDQGMDLRDYFAAKAMQAILSGINFGLYDWIKNEEIAKLAYMQADAMMEERDK